MPAPSNTSFATATYLSTFPTTVTQQVDNAGTTYTVYFSFTAPAGVFEVGVFGFGDVSVYRPIVTFWTDGLTTPVQFGGSAGNVPAQIPVTSGTQYWIKVTPNGGNPSPANLTLLVQVGATDTITAGMLAINDSSPGFPAVIMDPTTGEPVAFRHPFSAGEGVCVLRSGIVGALDIDLDGVVIYNADFTVRATPTMPTAGYTDALGTNQIDIFWALDRDTVATSFAVSLDADGVLGTPLNLGDNSFIGITPQADNAAVYGLRGTQIRKITNPGGVVTTFLTVDATYSFAVNPLMMTDDTLLVAYEKAANTTYIKRFNLSGVQVGSTITLTGVAFNTLEHLFAAAEDPTHFWIWYQSATHNYFEKIRVSDGNRTLVGPWPKFVEGVYEGAESATPEAYFGADFSCVPWILRTATPELPTPHIDNSVPCCADPCACPTPDGTPTTTGNPGPKPPPLLPAWTPACTGGGDLYDPAADPVDPESWDDPVEQTADTWLELRLFRYPASAGTLVRRYARRPFADAESWKEGRLVSLSKSRRACTDPDGNYDIGRVTAVLADGDGYLRGLLNEGTETEYFVNREAILYTATEVARKAGLARIRFRGWIAGVKLLADRQVQIEIADVVGSQFSGFNLDKEIGVPITAAEHPNAPDTTLQLIYPILGGERSDAGAVDANGLNAEKGIEPAIDCGDYDITGADPVSRVVLPPINLTVEVVGPGSPPTTGFRTVTYAVTAITATGETIPSAPVTITDAPGTFTADNYVHLTWEPASTFDAAHIIGYRVLGRTTNPPTMWLENRTNGGTFTAAETQFNDRPGGDPKSLAEVVAELQASVTGGTAVADWGNLIGIGTASPPADAAGLQALGTVPSTFDGLAAIIGVQDLYDLMSPRDFLPERPLPDLGTNTAEANDNLFAWMLLCIGYDYDILAVFGSNVPDGSEPVRTNLDALRGFDILLPQDAAWPHATNYRDIGGIRQFGFYARGNVLKHHRNGSCTLAVNICGPHDADEKVVNQLGKLDTWFLNEHVVKNNGTGYRTGDWGGPLETYENGDSYINKTKFDAAQAITVDWMGGLGYLADISIHAPMSVREYLRRRTISSGWRYAADHHGRIMPVVINDLADPTVGRLLRDRIEIVRNDDDDLAWDEVLNSIEYSYHNDSDAGTYLGPTGFTLDNLVSLAAHVPGGVTGDQDRRAEKKQVRELWGVNDPATAQDSQVRELLRRRRRPRYVQDTVDLLALNYEIGDQFRRTHYNGLGPNGDVETPMLALAYIEDYDRNQITIEYQDLRGIIADGTPYMGSEADLTAPYMGSELAEPPTAQEMH